MNGNVKMKKIGKKYGMGFTKCPDCGGKAEHYSLSGRLMSFSGLAALCCGGLLPGMIIGIFIPPLLALIIGLAGIFLGIFVLLMIASLLTYIFKNEKVIKCKECNNVYKMTRKEFKKYKENISL